MGKVNISFPCIFSSKAEDIVRSKTHSQPWISAFTKMMILKFGVILFLFLFLACDQTRDFVATFVESLDKEDLKVSEDQKNKKPQTKKFLISPRKNIYWDKENTFLNHFFAFKDNYLFFYNQSAGHLGWKSKGIRGETNATWISEIEWIAIFNKNLFLLGVGKDQVSLYKKPFESSVFLLNTIPLKKNSPKTNDGDSLENELLTPTASNQNFNLKQFNVILDATFKKDFIQILFSDYRLLNFSEDNFKKIEWIKPPIKIFKKPKQKRSFFYQMFLTEDPEMVYVTFKKYTLKGLDSILVDYLNVKTGEVIESHELKMGNRSFCAIESHYFITANFIKSKEKYSFHYKSLKNDENFTRSISIPGVLSPSHLKMENKFITGYYIKDDKVEFFQWK